MDKKYDMVVHRFRPSGKVEITRVSLFRLVAKLIAAGLLLMALTAAGSFFVFSKIYPRQVVVVKPLKQAEEKAPPEEAAPVLPAEPERVAKAAVPAAQEAAAESKPEPKETKPEPPPPDVDVRGFRVIEQEGGILVKFTVNNILEEEIAVSGYVVAVLETGDGELHTYPSVGLDPDGKPINFKNGRRFTIKRLIIINATFPVPLKDAEKVTVYSYDPQGRLRLTKDFDELG